MNGSNSLITTQRLETDVEGKDEYSADILSSTEAYIEPLNAQAAKNYAEYDMNMLYFMVCDGVVDVLISDRVTDDEDVTYKVIGVQSFKGGEIPSHTEVVMFKKRPIPR